MIIAGEASGDLHGAHLAARLRQSLPHVELYGIGSRMMCEAGVQLLYDSSAWSAIGISEAGKVFPRLLLAFRKLGNFLKANPPDVLVLIDFGFFNVRVGRKLCPPGTKVLYYLPPGSWRRNSDYAHLKGIPDRVVTQFPWSAQSLVENGFKADFFGHPLLDITKPGLSREEFCERFGFDPQRPIIGLLPGSRKQEIENNLPALLISAARMHKAAPDLQFAVPMAASVNMNSVARELKGIPWVDVESYSAGNDSKSGIGELSIAGRVSAIAREDGFDIPTSAITVKLLPGMACDILAHSRAALVTSGTATLEAAILGCPMVIVYRGTRLAELEFKLRGKNIKFIGMPNIILDRAACPELILKDATPARMAELMSKLIPDSPERAKMLSDLAEVKVILGSPGAINKTADVVLELLVPRQ